MFEKDLILLGIQGCGKGTQAALLLEKLPNHLYYEMGETLRAFHSNDNLIGNYMKGLMNKGEMVDNFITNSLAETAMKIAHKQNKYIMIDGFPRLEEQVDFFLKKNEELKRDFVVLHYALSQEKAIERMLKRASLEGRKDDNIESIKVRLGIFTNQTLIQIQRLEKLGKVITINADDTIEGVLNETLKKLGLE